MKTTDREIDDDPVEEHDDAADDGQHRRPQALVASLHPGVHQDRVDQERVEREDLLGIPSPGATPGMIRPDRAHHESGPEQDEGDFNENHRRAVQNGAETCSLVQQRRLLSSPPDDERTHSAGADVLDDAAFSLRPSPAAKQEIEPGRDGCQEYQHV